MSSANRSNVPRIEGDPRRPGERSHPPLRAQGTFMSARARQRPAARQYNVRDVTAGASLYRRVGLFLSAVGVMLAVISPDVASRNEGVISIVLALALFWRS
jgi:hypothetical protein